MRDHSQMYLFQWNSCRVLLEAPDRGVVESVSKLLALPFATFSQAGIPPDLTISSQGSVYRRITGRTYPCATREDLVLCLVTLISASFLEETPSVVLHAGAFVAAGCAVLFCGSAQSGKSLLAFTAWRRGYRLIGDDWVILNPDHASASPFPKPLKVRPHMGLLPEGDAQAHRQNDRMIGRLMDGELRWVFGRGLNQMLGYEERVPIGALFVVNRGRGKTTVVSPASRDEALTTILLQTKRTRAPGLGALKTLENLIRSNSVFTMEIGEGDIEGAVYRMVEYSAHAPAAAASLPTREDNPS